MRFDRHELRSPTKPLSGPMLHGAPQPGVRSGPLVGTGDAEFLRVRVTDASGKPLSNVQVAALNRATEDLGLIVRDGAVARTETDGGGLAELPRAQSETCVLASKAGFLPRTVQVAASTEECSVELQEGSPIQGEVVDPEGRAVPDVRVLALPSRSPTGSLDVFERALLAQFPSADTDERGEFEIRVSPDLAPHRLTVVGDGWTAPAIGHNRGMPQHVALGDFARLVVEPVRVFRIRLVHAGTAITTRPSAFSVLKTSSVLGVRRDPLLLSDGREWRFSHRPADPGVIEGVVRVRTPWHASERATIMLMVPGFASPYIAVPLYLPSEAPSAPDEVELTPLKGMDFGSVEATWSSTDGRVGTLYRAPKLRIVFDGTVNIQMGGRRLTWLDIDGTPIGSRRWRYDFVPCGEHEATLVGDDLGGSARVQRVSVQPNGVAAASFSPNHAASISLELVDAETRQRVFDAMVSLRPVAPPGDPILGLPALTRVPVGLVTGEHVATSVQLIPPGRYEVRVFKYGYESTTTLVEVAEGQVTTASMALKRQ